jgi:hypothetical protein
MLEKTAAADGETNPLATPGPSSYFCPLEAEGHYLPLPLPPLLHHRRLPRPRHPKANV